MGNRVSSHATAKLSIAALAMLLVLAVVVFIIFRSGGEGQEKPDSNMPATSALADRFEEISQVVIKDGELRTTLSRDGDMWRIPEKDGYPAVQYRVQSFLTDFAEAEAVERDQQEGGRLADLGLGENDGEWDRRIAFRDANGDVIADLVVGNLHSVPGAAGMSAVYLREAGGREVWLVEGDLHVSAEPMDWINRALLAIPKENIYEIRTLPNKGKTPLIMRRKPPEAMTIELVNLPAEAEIEATATVSDIPALFLSMRFDDVRAADDGVPRSDAQGSLRTLDGMRLNFWFKQGADAVWVRFALRTETPIIAEESDNGDDQNSAQQPDSIVAQGVALEKWAFRLPEYTREKLQRALEDFASWQEKDASAATPE